jgi:hypothetical protein
MSGNYRVILVVTLLAFAALACEETVAKTKVWGEMQCDTRPKKWLLDGDTTETGLEYDVECSLKDGRFSFLVKTGNVGNLSPEGVYYQLFGIGPVSENGPPEGAYVANYEVKEGFDGSLGGGQVAFGPNSWSFSSDKIIDDRCAVTSFYEALDGELTPPEYGNEKFDYVLKIQCTPGLDYVPGSNASSGDLTGVDLVLWFDNCD